MVTFGRQSLGIGHVPEPDDGDDDDGDDEDVEKLSGDVFRHFGADFFSVPSFTGTESVKE